MELELEKGHHEVAPGQHEIDFKFGSALKVADQATTYKFVVKNIAKSHNAIATFMPKPFEGMNGSGMHTHLSITAGGKNLFFDINHAERGYLSDIAMKYIGGILAHAKALVALTNPTVNSYKRLVPGFEAPVYVCWGRKNRSAMIRVPNFFPGQENTTRIELRVPDASCNPYLAFTAMLACGLDGIKNNIWPPGEADNNIYDMSDDERTQKGIQTLPSNLKEALENLKQNEVLKQALGEHTFNKFIEAKEKEINSGKDCDPEMI
ncbi:glutamine synthetase, partial [Candidatus Woesearchaeota archaeon]|nr:glutamine synthetase [Candidatus Woesearchaeota archaeon]